jgi:predicted O-linked N-acetylglucosamine transferase (SPINDLY family)
MAQSVVEINHMSAADTARRMRLDSLDIFLDTAFYTPWCRAELPYMGVAPINLRLQAWTRWISGAVYTYNIGDPITHPDDFDRQGWGPTFRLPSTCWLALEDAQAAQGLDRRWAGLPESALVLCGFTAGSTLDAESFALWMKALKRLPDALLWLPAYHAGARANLLREAAYAGVPAHRLCFSQDIAYSAHDHGISSRSQQLAQLALADLFVDPLRFSSAHALSDALRLGVPALAVRGHNMASRLGASIVHAAGLPEAVVANEAHWLDTLTQWAHSPSQQADWKRRLSATSYAETPSHLFNAAARTRDWERAFELMISRHRHNLPALAQYLASH